MNKTMFRYQIKYFPMVSSNGLRPFPKGATNPFRFSSSTSKEVVRNMIHFVRYSNKPLFPFKTFCSFVPEIIKQ